MEASVAATQRNTKALVINRSQATAVSIILYFRKEDFIDSFKRESLEKATRMLCHGLHEDGIDMEYSDQLVRETLDKLCEANILMCKKCQRMYRIDYGFTVLAEIAVEAALTVEELRHINEKVIGTRRAFLNT